MVKFPIAMFFTLDEVSFILEVPVRVENFVVFVCGRVGLGLRFLKVSFCPRNIGQSRLFRRFPVAVR
jgi:hypothetical protein